MTKARHLAKQLCLLLLVPVLAALYFAGPLQASVAPRAMHLAGASRASTAPRTVHLAAQSKPHHHPKKPCGIKHYPRCPKPKDKCHHKRPRPGQKVHVHSQHYPKHSTVRVYAKGHGRHKLLARVRMGKHGGKIYSVKIPKNFKAGKYVLVFKSKGQPTVRVTIHVKKRLHRRHHHHH